MHLNMVKVIKCDCRLRFCLHCYAFTSCIVTLSFKKFVVIENDENFSTTTYNGVYIRVELCTALQNATLLGIVTNRPVVLCLLQKVNEQE